MHGRIASIIVAAAGLSFVGCATKKDPQPPASPTAQSQQAAVAQAPAPQQPAKPVAAAPVSKPTAAAPAKPAAPAPAPAPAQAPAAAASDKTYTVKPGDNLWNISKQVYGDGTKYPRIVEANPGLNPDNMKPGTKIVIP